MNKDKVEKSRLGTLLLHKGLISQEQLYQALSMQSTENMMLGEILIQQGWISAQDLKNSLKKQSRYRIWAAVGAILLTPLQPFLATAATASTDTNLQSEKITHMQAMNETEMRQTTAQKRVSLEENELLQFADININELETSNQSLENIMNTLIPGADNLLNAQVSIEGVSYRKNQIQSVAKDGSVSIKLPSHIAKISLKDIEFKGMSGKHIGDIELSNISISPETKVTVRFKN